VVPDRTTQRTTDAEAGPTDAVAVATDVDRRSNVEPDRVAGQHTVTLGARLRLLRPRRRSRGTGDVTGREADANAEDADAVEVALDVDRESDVQRNRVAGEHAVALGARRCRLGTSRRVGERRRNSGEQESQA
jgi:hypothetical protein